MRWAREKARAAPAAPGPCSDRHRGGLDRGALALQDGGSAQAAVPEPNSADALIVWTACPQLLELTNAELDT